MSWLALPSRVRDGLHPSRVVTPRAKNVIYLHMSGSPPQQDLFDYKPELVKHDRKPCPSHLIENERFAFIRGHPKLLASPFAWRQHGETGTWVSELLPDLSRIIDKLAIVKSMHTDQFNHGPAQLRLFTGSSRNGLPAMGSWINYGLGSDNPDLPGFVVLVTVKVPSAGKSVWGSGFLPTQFAGVRLRSTGDPVLFLSNPPGIDRAVRRASLDVITELNDQWQHESGHPEIASRSAQYELAYRMQRAVPEIADIKKEPEYIHQLYGTSPGAATFANNCLLARRLVEHGVRFVQLYDWGWDTHGTSKSDDLLHQLPRKCRWIDRPITALLLDLEQRGLLDETLVVWSGEFGRTPMNEERNGSKFLGRDHHPHCFTAWLAGGGVKPGARIGETDDLGYHVAADPVHVLDLQATILYLLGIDHKRLTWRHLGRDYRLTDVGGRVVRGLLA